MIKAFRQYLKNRKIDKQVAAILKTAKTEGHLEFLHKSLRFALEQVTPLIALYIKEDKRVENFLIIPAISPDPEDSFNVIIHKRGKKLPNRRQMEINGGLPVNTDNTLEMIEFLREVGDLSIFLGPSGASVEFSRYDTPPKLTSTTDDLHNEVKTIYDNYLKHKDK